MKKVTIILLISFMSNFVWSQVIFNRIIQDTVAHITSSVIALDTGYVVVSGTGNQYGVRSFALQHIDLHGNRKWKNIYGTSEEEYWEGFSNCLLSDENSPTMSGTIIDNNYDNYGVSLFVFDSLYHSHELKTFQYDTLWKKAFNITVSSSNDFYITGQNYNNEIGNYHMYLLKVNSAFELLWQKSYGNRYEGGSQIIETNDKNILVGGRTFSFPTTITDEDWYLLKLDTAGNVIWEKGFGRGGFLNYDGPVRGLIETSDSNYIACGGYPALRSDTDTYWDGCVRKVTQDGELMWEKFFRNYTFYPPIGPTTFRYGLSAILQQENNDLMILGNSYSYYPRQRGVLMRTNSEGQIKWCRHYYAIDSTSRDQYLVSVKETQDKGFILAGYGNDYDSFGYNPPQQAWLVKTDSLGLDGLCYTEAPELNFDIEIPESVCINDTMQVYVYIAGKSAPYTIEFSTGQIIDSIYYPPTFVPVEIGLSLAEIEYGGDIIYSEQITEATLSNHEWGQCIAKPIEFYTPYNNGISTIDITVTDAYGESKTVTKSISVIECGDLVKQENICPVKLYPNPVFDRIYVDIPEDMNIESVEIYNSAGQIVKNTTIYKGLNVIDVSDFASGIYILRISTKNKTYDLNFEKK